VSVRFAPADRNKRLLTEFCTEVASMRVGNDLASVVPGGEHMSHEFVEAEPLGPA
jgi:hypothetical protein